MHHSAKDMCTRENLDRELLHRLANRFQVLMLSDSIDASDRLCRQVNHWTRGRRVLTVGGTFALLQILCTIRERKPPQGVARRPDTTGVTPTPVRDAVRTIEEHAQDSQFTLAVLGRSLGVSKFHLDRLLKKNTGESFTVLRRKWA